MPSFSRLILLDRRGTGLSDHVVEREHQNIESHMDDVRAVMDAAGSERAVLLGFESGFAVAAMFAATFPERTTALISFGSKARELWAPDYPFGRPAAEFDAELLEIERDWATPRLAQLWLSFINPEAKDNSGRSRTSSAGCSPWVGRATPCDGPRSSATSICGTCSRRSACPRSCYTARTT